MRSHGRRHWEGRRWGPIICPFPLAHAALRVSLALLQAEGRVGRDHPTAIFPKPHAGKASEEKEKSRILFWIRVISFRIIVMKTECRYAFP